MQILLDLAVLDLTDIEYTYIFSIKLIIIQYIAFIVYQCRLNSVFDL